jgi:hypothetical protein
MRRLLIMACVLAGSLAAPLAAHAGTYTVAICDPGAGNANNAMNFSANISTNIDSASSCGTSGKSGLQTWSSDATPGGHAGAWWFYAPSGTSITHLDYSGVFDAFSGWVSHWATNGNGSGDPDSGGDCPTANVGCQKPDSVSTAVGGGTTLGFGIWCDAGTCAPNHTGSTFGPAGSANVYQADITVSEPSPPSLSASGNLTTEPAGATISAGEADWTLGFSATDPAGPCVLQAIIENSSGAVVLQDADNVSPNDTLAAPCGQATRIASWQPDLASLPNGAYDLYVQSNNPAGMVSTDLVKQLNIDNTGESTNVAMTSVHALKHRCRGRGRHRHCRYVELKHRRGPLSLSFGQPGIAVGSVKTTGGAPLQDSPVDIYAHSRGWGTRLVATTLTNSAGAFLYLIPSGPSRTLTFVFPGAGTVLASLRQVNVNVGGRATLKLIGGLRAGRRALFEGRVLGGYIPEGAKLVQLRYRVPGATGWAPFGPDIYAGRNGRWRARVRIGAGAAGYTYQLDAYVPKQGDWPYRRAISRTVTATVR